MTREEIERLLDHSEDDLYLLLAQADPTYGDEMFAPAEARARGLQTFGRLADAMRQRVCVEWRYCERRTEAQFHDEVTVAIAIADVLTGILGAIPVATVAVLLVKRGVSGFCGCDDRGG